MGSAADTSPTALVVPHLDGVWDYDVSDMHCLPDVVNAPYRHECLNGKVVVLGGWGVERAPLLDSFGGNEAYSVWLRRYDGSVLGCLVSGTQQSIADDKSLVP